MQLFLHLSFVVVLVGSYTLLFFLLFLTDSLSLLLFLRSHLLLTVFPFALQFVKLFSLFTVKVLQLLFYLFQLATQSVLLRFQSVQFLLTFGIRLLLPLFKVEHIRLVLFLKFL